LFRDTEINYLIVTNRKTEHLDVEIEILNVWGGGGGGKRKEKK